MLTWMPNLAVGLDAPVADSLTSSREREAAKGACAYTVPPKTPDCAALISRPVPANKLPAFHAGWVDMYRWETAELLDSAGTGTLTSSKASSALRRFHCFAVSEPMASSTE